MAPPTKNEIKAFVSGSYPAEPVPMAYHDIMNDFSQGQQYSKRAFTNEPQDLLSRAEQLKVDRAI